MFLVCWARRKQAFRTSGWKRTQWWDGPLTFWDDFTDDGALTSDSPAVSPVGSIAVTQTLPAGGESTVTFLLAWHFPNRTPDRCGWPAPENEQKTVVVGNYYCQRFTDAWKWLGKWRSNSFAGGAQPLLRGCSGIFHLASRGAGGGAQQPLDLAYEHRFPNRGR